MLGEIIVSLILTFVLVLLFYLYLGWCNSLSGIVETYKYNPAILNASDQQKAKSYGWLVLPTYLADTYKPIRFQIEYQIAKIENN